MNKAEMEKELGDLIYRFKVLKKALAQEDENLSPAHRMIAEIAQSLKTPSAPPPPKLTREQVLVKAREMLEQRHSQNLANQLQKAGILTQRPPQQPTSKEQEQWLVNNGFDTEETLAKAEEGWGKNPINNWLLEAQKPISQRFKSEEEERAYWDRIKVGPTNRDEGSGY